MYYVYVLFSGKDEKLYVGYTNDLFSRLHKHNAGKVRATKSRLPLKLIYYEACLDMQEARDREHYLKTGWGRRFIAKRLARTIARVKD